MPGLIRDTVTVMSGFTRCAFGRLEHQHSVLDVVEDRHGVNVDRHFRTIARVRGRARDRVSNLVAFGQLAEVRVIEIEKAGRHIGHEHLRVVRVVGGLGPRQGARRVVLQIGVEIVVEVPSVEPPAPVPVGSPNWSMKLSITRCTVIGVVLLAAL